MGNKIRNEEKTNWICAGCSRECTPFTMFDCYNTHNLISKNDAFEKDFTKIENQLCVNCFLNIT